jgi:hypothetical protein
VNIVQWISAFESMHELRSLGGEGLALFALTLRFGIEDITSVAAEVITDGTNDKKIDILYVDKTIKSAFIMQCYLSSTKLDKPAKMNKATDLHAAVSYAFSVTEDHLPEVIKSQVTNFRQAIKDGDIDTIYIWYVHNRTEDARIQRELSQVEIAALAAANSNFPSRQLRFISQEVGRATLSEWYEKSGNAIAVSDEIHFEGVFGFETHGPSWRSFVTSVSGQALHRLYKQHEKDLFSLNVRDYLGIVKKDANVNNGIKSTAGTQPENFWAYNNGITAIVHDYHYIDHTLIVTGISIVNGAQTTGALGNLEEEPASDLRVPARFFKTSDQNIIDAIIKFNNSQNAVEASDFRSTDPIQRRLVSEFNAIPGVDYDGGRRGSVSDAIKRRPNLLPSYTVGQALSAFHGDPVIAYNEKSRIWTDNSAYEKVFNEHVSARHIMFCLSLLRAIEARKTDLIKRSRIESEALDEQAQNEVSFFRQKGSQFLLVYIVSHCIDQIIGRATPNKFNITFQSDNFGEMQANWTPVLDVFLAFAPRMVGYLSDGLKSNEKSRSSAEEMRQTLQAIIKFNEQTYSAFSRAVRIG